MTYTQFQPYLFPTIVVLFLAYRFYRFQVIRKKLPNLLKEGALLIDVRSTAEFAAGHNPKSINIPLGELNEKSQTLDKSQTILLCCASGTRSGMGVGILKKNGFQHVLNAGSWTNT